MAISNWTPDRLPSLAGKRYFITGGNSGIGLDTARHLRVAGADVVIAARSEHKGKAAITTLTALSAPGSLDLVSLDLADTDSIKAAADDMHARFHDGFDAIINNAGIMHTPQQKTADGFEMQFGTNHLGHFLLNALTLDLVSARDGRVVTVSSIAARMSKGINFDDVMYTTDYNTNTVYAQSKLANLLYGAELARRFDAAGGRLMSVCVHPGYSATNLQSTGPTGVLKAAYSVLNRLVAQPSEKGSYPSTLGAGGSEARNGAYYGPTSMGGMRGPVGDVAPSEPAQDDAAAVRLWELSEELLDVKYEVPHV